MKTLILFFLISNLIYAEEKDFIKTKTPSLEKQELVFEPNRWDNGGLAPTSVPVGSFPDSKTLMPRTPIGHTEDKPSVGYSKRGKFLHEIPE